MLRTNQNYKLLQDSYLFPEMKRKVSLVSDKSPRKKIFNLGEGDTSRPLAKPVSQAMITHINNMKNNKAFMGYSDPLGIAPLRSHIYEMYKEKYSINLKMTEVFISDGAKADLFNIQNIFQAGMKIALQNPAYPAYIDSMVINGNGDKLVYLMGDQGNNFIPEVPHEKVDIIYLCFPNNPTGATAAYADLKKYVDYAVKNNVLIIFDAVYSWFIQEPDCPMSIYEIPGADECAIEIQSLSKIASFANLRLGWTVIPNKLLSKKFKLGEINAIWKRRQQTAFNGPSTITQMGAISVLSDFGLKECYKNIAYYLENTKHIKRVCEEIGLECYGGTNSPYVWCKTPNNMTSWNFFDFLLEKSDTICTPGVGFGSNGEGFFRLSGFASKGDTKKSMILIKKAFQSLAN